MFQALLSEPTLGLHFIMRWLHVFFGVVWIGHLYYFNFVQGAFLNETDANAKSQVVQKLVPRALWWFRWGAMGTFLTGLVMLGVKGHMEAKQGGMEIFASPYWITILTGAFMATLMFLNVWLIIWPAQKIVIASAKQVAAGGQSDPEAAKVAPKAGLASRTNTLFSIPMLFYMLSASHLGYSVDSGSNLGLYWALIVLVVGGLQLNGMVGKMGPMTSVKGVITCGFALTAVLALINLIAI